MSTKTLFISIATFIIAAMALFFYTNPSYEKSLEAKYFYETGKYEKAYALATEAFALDRYNKMAATVMAQSKISLKYTKYIQDAKRYLQEINTILQKESITDADKTKIKMISQIMVQSYTKLAPSVVLDKKLIADAKRYYEKFKKILEKVDS